MISEQLLLKTVLLFPEHYELLEFFSKVLGIPQKFVLKKLFSVSSSLGIFI
jgi:hypothetical protein